MSEERIVNDTLLVPTGTRPWRGLLATSVHLGHYAWTERRLFELLGAWSVLEEDPAVKVLFDAQSHEHAWHAEVLIDRLPELREVDVDTLLVPPSEGFAAVIDTVAGFETLVERAVGLHGVLVPHLIDAYRHELAGTTEVAGASLMRWLKMILADLSEEASRGVELCESSLRDDSSRTLATSVLAELTASLERVVSLVDD